MERMGNLPIICDVKTFNERVSGGINPNNNDPPYEPEKKLGWFMRWVYGEHPHFFSHICEAIIIFKDRPPR